MNTLTQKTIVLENQLHAKTHTRTHTHLLGYHYLATVVKYRTWSGAFAAMFMQRKTAEISESWNHSCSRIVPTKCLLLKDRDYVSVL